MEIKTPFDHPLTDAGIVRWFGSTVERRLPEWRARLATAPEELASLEQETMGFGREVTQRLLAAILAAATVQAAVEARAEQVRRQTAGLPRKVYARPRRVVFLCGLALTMICCYCAPRRRKDQRGIKRGVGRRGAEGAGVYPAFAVLGIREGASPQLQSEAARMVALLPSMDCAREELRRHGSDLDVKTVRRIALELGTQALALRREDLQAWREGRLAAGTAFAGKRIVVAIDGGRARLREARRKGKRTKKGRRRFDTPWREPKLVTIYELDEQGRIDRSSLRTVDATLQGPDHLAELTAYHLHRLGAAGAHCVEFVADGSDWIWERVPRIMAGAKLEPNRCHLVLDICHAVSHIAAALEALGYQDREHKKLLTQLRAVLLTGQVDAVIERLHRLASGRTLRVVEQTIAYLSKRRHLMRYGTLRRKKLPIGSGAVESAIRRVINLRLKSPGMFWNADNLEAMMCLRIQALTGGWDAMCARVRERSQRSRDKQWRWTPTPATFAAPPTPELIFPASVTEPNR